MNILLHFLTFAKMFLERSNSFFVKPAFVEEDAFVPQRLRFRHSHSLPEQGARRHLPLGKGYAGKRREHSSLRYLAPFPLWAICQSRWSCVCVTEDYLNPSYEISPRIVSGGLLLGADVLREIRRYRWNFSQPNLI